MDFTLYLKQQEMRQKTVAGYTAVINEFIQWRDALPDQSEIVTQLLVLEYKSYLKTIRLIAVGIFWIYPFVWMVSSSLKDNVTFNKAAINPIPDVFIWENYARAWEVANISQYFMNSVIITVTTVVIWA